MESVKERKAEDRRPRGALKKGELGSIMRWCLYAVSLREVSVHLGSLGIAVYMVMEAARQRYSSLRTRLRCIYGGCYVELSPLICVPFCLCTRLCRTALCNKAKMKVEFYVHEPCLGRCCLGDITNKPLPARTYLCITFTDLRTIPPAHSLLPLVGTCP